ncbi:unnamed protein product, partial [Prorocentrum cordatum]
GGTAGGALAFGLDKTGRGAESDNGEETVVEDFAMKRADRLMRRLTFFGVELASEAALADFIQADHRPRSRKCPFSEKQLGKHIRSHLAATTGTSEPEKLPNGVLLARLNGAKEMERIFQKRLLVAKTVQGRNKYRAITLFCSSESMRERHKASFLKLTSSIYIATNCRTRYTKRKFVSHPTCSNTGDVLGPVEMPSMTQLRRLKKPDKVAYYRKRLARIGGEVSGDDEDDMDDAIE